MVKTPSLGLVEALHADGPAPDRTDALELYAFLIGSWEAEVVTYDTAGQQSQGRAEIHAGWILEGRAIQDVWMIPPRGERGGTPPQLPVAGNWYGTTLRVYDTELDAWRIFWMDPATNNFTQQIGRRIGNNIVQEGREGSNVRTRWSFTELKPNSFHWLGERSLDEGATWTLLVEVFGRRQAQIAAAR